LYHRLIDRDVSKEQTEKLLKQTSHFQILTMTPAVILILRSTLTATCSHKWNENDS